MMLKKAAFYLLVLLFVFAGQFLVAQGLLTGQPAPILQTTLNGENPMTRLQQGPAILYFWAEWCGVCRSMQGNIDAVLQDNLGLTVAVRSSDRRQLEAYLQKNQLHWPVIDDHQGSISQLYGVKAVPALFFINPQGRIIFTSVGYTSELGLRLRLWLVGLL